MTPAASTSSLILGGRGFVGSAIAQAARRAGWLVSVAGRHDCGKYVNRRFDVLINANGNARRFKADTEVLWDFDASVRSVYQSLVDFEFGHYVLLSSVDVYNDTTGAATTAESTPIDPAGLTPYGFHKRLAELCVAHRARSWQVVRLAQMVGPNLKKGPIFDILEGRPLWVHPSAEFPVMSTQAVGEVVVGLIERAPRNEFYNVCGRGSVEMSRILDLFGLAPDDPPYADRERQTYRIDVAKTHRICPLPDSWSEVAAFVAAAKAARKAS